MKRLIYFDGLELYLRYDNLLNKFDLAEEVSNASIYDYWFTVDQVGTVLYYDFGTDSEIL